MGQIKFLPNKIKKPEELDFKIEHITRPGRYTPAFATLEVPTLERNLQARLNGHWTWEETASGRWGWRHVE